jgi:SAM-dependent methyltransferase
MSIQLKYEGADQNEQGRALARVRGCLEFWTTVDEFFQLYEERVRPALGLVREQGPRKSVVEYDVGMGFHLDSFADQDYLGFGSKRREVGMAKAAANEVGIGQDSIRHIQSLPFRLPAGDRSADAAFSFCTFHRFAGYHAILAEMDRILRPGGRLAVVERLCALGKTADEIARIKGESTEVIAAMERMGYSVTPELFPATFYGEFTEGNGLELFDFFMVSGTKR